MAQFNKKQKLAHLAILCVLLLTIGMELLIGHQQRAQTDAYISKFHCEIKADAGFEAPAQTVYNCENGTHTHNEIIHAALKYYEFDDYAAK